MLSVIGFHLFRAHLMRSDVMPPYGNLSLLHGYGSLLLLHGGLPIIMVGIPCAECTPVCASNLQFASEALVYSL